MGSRVLGRGEGNCRLGTSGRNAQLLECPLCLGYSAQAFDKRGWEACRGVQLAWRGGVSARDASSSDALPLQGWPFKPQSMMSPQTARGGRGTAGLRTDCISRQPGVRHTLPSRHWPRRTINQPGAGFQGDSTVAILGREWGSPGGGMVGAGQILGPGGASGPRFVISPRFLCQRRARPPPPAVSLRDPGAQHHSDPIPTLLRPCPRMPAGLPFGPQPPFSGAGTTSPSGPGRP